MRVCVRVCVRVCACVCVCVSVGVCMSNMEGICCEGEGSRDDRVISGGDGSAQSTLSVCTYTQYLANHSMRHHSDIIVTS